MATGLTLRSHPGHLTSSLAPQVSRHFPGREERPLALFQGTGLRHSDQLPGLVGGEFDFVQDGSPGNPETAPCVSPGPLDPI